MLHAKFRQNHPTGSGLEDLKGFKPYMAMAAILVMWPYLIFRFSQLLPKSLLTEFGVKWPSGFREKQVLILIRKLYYLGPRSRNKNELEYSLIFLNMYLISCLHLPALRSHAAIICERIHYFSLFPEERP